MGTINFDNIPDATQVIQHPTIATKICVLHRRVAPKEWHKQNVADRLVDH